MNFYSSTHISTCHGIVIIKNKLMSAVTVSIKLIQMIHYILPRLEQKYEWTDNSCTAGMTCRDQCSICQYQLAITLVWTKKKNR